MSDGSADSRTNVTAGAANHLYGTASCKAQRNLKPVTNAEVVKVSVSQGDFNWHTKRISYAGKHIEGSHFILSFQIVCQTGIEAIPSEA